MCSTAACAIGVIATSPPLHWRCSAPHQAVLDRIRSRRHGISLTAAFHPIGALPSHRCNGSHTVAESAPQSCTNIPPFFLSHLSHLQSYTRTSISRFSTHGRTNCWVFGHGDGAGVEGQTQLLNLDSTRIVAPYSTASYRRRPCHFVFHPIFAVFQNMHIGNDHHASRAQTNAKCHRNPTVWEYTKYSSEGVLINLLRASLHLPLFGILQFLVCGGFFKTLSMLPVRRED